MAQPISPARLKGSVELYAAEEIVIDPELVLRDSTGPAPAEPRT